MTPAGTARESEEWRDPRIWGVADHFAFPKTSVPIEIHSASERPNRLRLRSHNGAEVVIAANNGTRALASILAELIIPLFLGKDVRQTEYLIQLLYRDERNYKYARMRLWSGYDGGSERKKAGGC